MRAGAGVVGPAGVVVGPETCPGQRTNVRTHCAHGCPGQVWPLYLKMSVRRHKAVGISRLEGSDSLCRRSEAQVLDACVTRLHGGREASGSLSRVRGYHLCRGRAGHSQTDECACGRWRGRCNHWTIWSRQDQFAQYPRRQGHLRLEKAHQRPTYPRRQAY